VYGIPPLLRKHQITYRTNNIMGSPVETLEDMFETVRVNKRIKPQGCTVLIYRAFKSTVLGQEDFERGASTSRATSGPRSRTTATSYATTAPRSSTCRNSSTWPSTCGREALVRRLIRLPRNRLFELTQLSFLWYQHAVISGYGMLDDLLLA